MSEKINSFNKNQQVVLGWKITFQRISFAHNDREWAAAEQAMPK